MEPQNPGFDRRKFKQPFPDFNRRVKNRREKTQPFSNERRRREKRRLMRKPFSTEISLTCQNAKITCFPKDINREGVKVVIHSQPDLMAEYLVRIGLKGRVFFELPARILHSEDLNQGKKFQIGLQFSAISPLERNLLETMVSGLPLAPVSVSSSKASSSSSQDNFRGHIVSAEQKDFNNKLEIDRFLLLVNGKDVDTGQYDYFPYADKLITDRKKTLWMMNQLKSGHLPEKYGEYLYAQYCLSKEDTNQLAIQAAYKASQEFRYWNLKKRRKIMGDVYEVLLENREKLIELMVVEGHPVRLATWEFEGMEAAYRPESLDYYEEKIAEEIKNNNSRERLFLIRRPDGVVCAIPPKNASCSNSLVAGFALLAGNALIVKPPLKAPVSTIFLWRNVVFPALEANNAPRGVLNVISGNSNKILDDWLNSPFVDDVLYFGDSATGMEVGAKIYRAGKKPILELSGSDLMFIWKDAPLEESVSGLLDGFLGSTQICMVPKKALIHEDIYEKFKALFISKVKALKIGLPTEEGVILSPVMKIPQFFRFLENALEKGAKLLCGGERVNHKGEVDRNGMYVTPAVLEINDVEKALKMQCFVEENFFPLIPIVKVKAGLESKENKDQTIFNRMVSLSNEHPFGLRLSAWVSSKDYINQFSDRFQNSGLLRINSRHVGFSCGLGSHGGTKRSGGPFGEMNYFWQKTSHLQGISITHPGSG